MGRRTLVNLIATKSGSFHIEYLKGESFLIDDVWIPSPSAALTRTYLLFGAMEGSISCFLVLGVWDSEGASPSIFLLTPWCSIRPSNSRGFQVVSA